MLKKARGASQICGKYKITLFLPPPHSEGRLCYLQCAQQFFIYYLFYIYNIYKSILILHKDIATKNLCHIDLF